MLLKKNSLISSSLRNMTNATFSSSIGMTLGTSGCASHSIVHNDKRGLHFAEANLEILKADMAVGAGENIEAFALTMGCSAASVRDFATAMKHEYSYVVPAADVRADQLVERTKVVISTSSNLVHACASAVGA
jgi:hypothetical protein